MLPQHTIMKLTQRLSKGQRHEKTERVDRRKQSEKWDGKYERVYPCEWQWEGEDHQEGHGERIMGMACSQWRRGTMINSIAYIFLSFLCVDFMQ